ncbi:hypothetical protein ACFL1E_01880 [Candidatus Omnitrophota bacterium]
MKFVCPTCQEQMDQDLLIVVPHTEQHIVDEIKKKHPEWQGKDGVCKKCYVYFKKQLHPG